MHIIHTWGKWKDTKTGNVIDYIDGVRVIAGSFIEQQKECSICGKKKIRQTQSI